MDVEERRKPQTGTMKLALDGGRKREVKLQTAGTTAGEYLRMMFEPRSGTRHGRSSSSGSPSAARRRSSRRSADRTGVVLVSHPQGAGADQHAVRDHPRRTTPTWSTSTRSSATRTRTWRASPRTSCRPTPAPADELKQMDWVISQEPDVRHDQQARGPAHGGVAGPLRHRGQAGLRGDAGRAPADAVEQWRKLAGDDNPATENLKLVIVGRVLRKLCMACKDRTPRTPTRSRS